MLSQLKLARIKSGKTIQEVASDLKIRKYYLVALEEGNIELLPGEIYARGYLKLYTDYLGLTEAELSEELNEKAFVSNSLLYNKKDIPINYKYRKSIIILSIVLLPVITVIYYLILKN